jgi:hypothetical protein
MSGYDSAPVASTRFPWWIGAGAVVLALAYLPTLAAPFDFIDDGNLVYPAPPGTTFREHVNLWWDKVANNVDHLGPFRPVLWLHWYVQANLFGAEPLAWRTCRLMWCALAAGTLLWLFRELHVPPFAALLAGAAAMWNPYRNEVWMSLTLSEGVAMPYALFALGAARRAANARRPVWWDVTGIACVLIALGCKNTFAALVPAQMLLRMWPDGDTFRNGWHTHGRRALLFLLPLALPLGHFVYFKLHWHAGQYEANGPSAEQFARYLVCLKGAAGVDFLGAGVVIATVVVWVRANGRCQPAGVWRIRPARAVGVTPPTDLAAGVHSIHRPADTGRSPAFACALLLLLAGVVVYLPVAIISGRYAMPAVWGIDVLFALLLTALLKLPASLPRSAAFVAVGAGLAVVLLVNVNRQERAATRARMLWNVARHIESTAPLAATVAWVSGDSALGGLGVEEGIHMQWHLEHRGRPDIRIALFDAHEQPISRAELPRATSEPLLRVANTRTFAEMWEPDRSFGVVYQFGQKRYDCHVSRRAPPSQFADANTRTNTVEPFRAPMPSSP